MKLSELLDYIGTDLLDDRAALLEGVSDSIWSDVAIVRQLNEAQRVMCRRAWILKDADFANSVDGDGNPICQIQLVQDQTDYAFHKSILHIESARLSDSELDLLQVTYQDNRIRTSPWVEDPDFWDINSIQVELSGRPSRWSADIGTRIIRLRRKPDAASALLTVNFAVTRMPARPLDVKDTDAEPEIPEEYHMIIARAAAGRLLQHPTVDSEMRALGNSWITEFEAECKEARRDRESRQNAMPQMRAAGWASDNYRNGWGR